jgi:hypothetical protein
MPVAVLVAGNSWHQTLTLTEVRVIGNWLNNASA